MFGVVLLLLLSLGSVSAGNAVTQNNPVCSDLLDCYARAIQLTKKCYRSKSQELRAETNDSCDSNSLRQEVASIYIADRYSKIASCLKGRPSQAVKVVLRNVRERL
ncbi:unnamed protein product [Soboliphyme baturini]|uniref:Secreted protein n=1 Tax=Soboliphyme baturini TaxID=241478 RepID=A0A183IV04_9BILA|nr:unnamed protein product [Soboliphyme baturini]